MFSTVFLFLAFDVVIPGPILPSYSCVPPCGDNQVCTDNGNVQIEINDVTHENVVIVQNGCQCQPGFQYSPTGNACVVNENYCTSDDNCQNNSRCSWYQTNDQFFTNHMECICDYGFVERVKTKKCVPDPYVCETDVDCVDRGYCQFFQVTPTNRNVSSWCSCFDFDQSSNLLSGNCTKNFENEELINRFV